MRQNTTIIGSGVAGNNIAANTNIASCLNLAPGRYKMSGTARHSLADGLKVTGIPGGTIIIPGGPGDTIVLPELVFDLTNTVVSNNNIQIALNQATGASDTAAAVLCLESLNQGA